MRRRLAAVGAAALIALSLLPAPARAVSVDDYLQAGYRVIATTFVPGLFTGCEKGQSITFEDGTVFVCQAVHTQAMTHPRVYVLRAGAEPASAVLIGGQLYGGSLVSLRGRPFPQPITLENVPLDFLPRPPPVPPTTLMTPNEPIQSINQLEALTQRRLNDAQRERPEPPYHHTRDE